VTTMTLPSTNSSLAVHPVPRCAGVLLEVMRAVNVFGIADARMWPGRE
jgi:hypothetical protein